MDGLGRFRKDALKGCISLLLVALAASHALAQSDLPTGTGNRLAVDSASDIFGEVSYIFDVVVDRDDPSSLVLATRSGLYRITEDEAATAISERRDPIWELAGDPATSDRLYALGSSAEGGSRGLLVSRDSGQSWRRRPVLAPGPGYLQALEVSKADPSMIFAAGNREFWIGRQGGARWDQAGTPPSRIIALAASALNGETVYAATMAGLLVSRTAGRTWQVAAPTVCRQPVTAVDTGGDGVVYAFSLCRGLLKGNETTNQWAVVRNDFGGCIVQHLAVDPTNSDRVYAVIRCDRVLLSRDGGRSWREFGSSETWVPDCLPEVSGRASRERLDRDLTRKHRFRYFG